MNCLAGKWSLSLSTKPKRTLTNPILQRCALGTKPVTVKRAVRGTCVIGVKYMRVHHFTAHTRVKAAGGGVRWQTWRCVRAEPQIHYSNNIFNACVSQPRRWKLSLAAFACMFDYRACTVPFVYHARIIFSNCEGGGVVLFPKLYFCYYCSNKENQDIHKCTTLPQLVASYFAKTMRLQNNYNNSRKQKPLDF